MKPCPLVISSVDGALDSVAATAETTTGSGEFPSPPTSGKTQASASAASHTNLRGQPTDDTTRSSARAPAATSIPISAAYTIQLIMTGPSRIPRG